MTKTVAWTDLPAEREEPPLGPPALMEGIPAPTDEFGVAGRLVSVRVPRHVLEPLLDHFRADPQRERLCLLLGRPWRTNRAGQYVVTLASFVPVRCETASAVHVAMRGEDWTRILPGLTGEDDEQLLGWAHSHPGHGAFLSQTDLATQGCWFARPWSVALVFDPVRGELRCFAGPEGGEAQLLVDGGEQGGA